MEVGRNMLGDTSSVEAMGCGKRWYDSFFCHHSEENRHRKISRLKRDIYLAELEKDPFYKKKKTAKRKILNLLANHADG